jgi:GxxExxY protein
VPIQYGDLTIEAELRLDLLVNDLVIIEVKSVENLNPVYEAQIMTYMKLLKKPQGLLINFFSTNISQSMKPIVNEYFKILPE